MFAPAFAKLVAGSRRFWITVACFAIANTLTWVGYHYTLGRPALLRVETFEPWDSGSLSGRTSLRWKFNLDAADNIQRQAPGVITPAIPGKWMWEDNRTLAFRPDTEWTHATRYHIVLPVGHVRTPQGFALGAAFDASMTTEQLALTDVRQVEVGQDDHVLLELVFNERVAVDEVIKHLKVADANGKPIAFHAHGENNGNIVRVMTETAPGLSAGQTHYWVCVTAGLGCAAGPVTMCGDALKEVQVGGRPIVTSIEGHSSASGDSRIVMHINTRLSESEMQRFNSLLSVTPTVSYAAHLTNVFTNEGSDCVTLLGPFEPGQRYTLTVAQPPAGMDANRIPRADVLSAFIPNRPPRVWMEHDEGYLGSHGNRTLLAHATNVSNMKVSVARVYENNIVEWQNQNRHAGRQLMSLARPLVTKALKVATEKNKPQDVRLCLDDLLPANAPRMGVYTVAVASERGDEDRQASGYGERYIDDEDDYMGYGDWNSSALVTLSDIGLTAKCTADGAVVWAVSLSTAKPIAGAHIRLYTNKNQLMGQADTDASGVARITAPPPPTGENAAVLIAQLDGDAAGGNEMTWLKLSDNELSLRGVDTGGKPYLRGGYDAMVYSERGVYRPGETVHLRGIVRGNEASGMPHFPVRWQILRPDLHDWQSQTVTLDADGMACWDLTLPDDVSPGRWTAQIELPRAAENGKKVEAQVLGTMTFRVEEFVPNRMKVALEVEGGPKGKAPEAEKRFSMLDGAIKARIKADYLFGRPVAQRPATLNLRVEPGTFSPDKWPGWTMADSAQTVRILDETKALGIAKELDAQQTDNQGSASWDLAADLFDTEEADQDKPAATSVHHHHHLRHAGSNDDNALAAAAVVGPTTAPADDASKAKFVGPWHVSLAASVTETGGRAVTANRDIEVDTVACYPGIGPIALARPGEAVDVEVALVAPDGKAANVNRAMSVLLYHQRWNNTLVFSDGRYHFDTTRLLEAVGAASDVPLAQGRGVCPLTPVAPGDYVVRVVDKETGAMASRAFMAVDINRPWDDSISRENPQQLELVVAPMPASRVNFAELVQAAKNNDAGSLQKIGQQLWAGAQAHVPHEEKANPSDDKTATEPKLRAGQQAQIIVRSPFAGRLLLTVETDRVVSTRVIDMPASHMVVPIEVGADCRPNAYVTASVVQAIDPNAKWRTHRAFGAARLMLDNNDCKLTVRIAAPTEIRPLQSLGVDVMLSDANGHAAANTAVTVAAVDEGICQLTSFHTPDPWAFFTSPRALGVTWMDLYDALMPESPRPDKVSSVGGDGSDEEADAGRHQTPVTARRFRSVALVSQQLHTDENGVAHADFPLPEFTGQLRVMAIAGAEHAFGSAEKFTVVRSPLLVQSSWPRFAAPGDSFTVPLAIFNNSSAAGHVSVQVELLGDTDSPLAIAGAAPAEAHGRILALDIAAGAQATAGFDIAVAQRAGVAHARITATMGSETCVENVELPIRPANPTVSLGGYVQATVDEPVKITVPGGMLDGTGDTDINLAARPALELPRGLDYLERYPYGCVEQTTSTCFPLVYLDQIGAQIAPGVFEKQRVAEKVHVGITRLIGMQTADGGLAMWTGGHDDWPWASVYAAHFIVVAEAAGHPVPSDFKASLLKYVRGLLNVWTDDTATLETQAYACYVLALAGKPERALMTRLGETMKGAGADPNSSAAAQPNFLSLHGPSNQARLHLAAAWLAAGRKDLAEAAIPAVLPQPRSQRQRVGNVGSPIRDRAILLDTLLSVRPNDGASAGLVEQLAASGRQGQWSSTQDVAFAVMAMGHYLKVTRNQRPYATAQLLQNGVVVASSTDGQPLHWCLAATRHRNANEAGSVTSTSPAADVARTASAISGPTTAPGTIDGELELRLTGPAGACGYLCWLKTGVPLAPIQPASQGMQVSRRYLDSQGQPLGDTVRSGDLVQVELTVDAPTSLEHVVIDDLLPAGLEIENTNLDTTVDVRMVKQQHRNGDDSANAPPVLENCRTSARDDRLILLGDYPGGKPIRHIYLTRAVTPGIYTVPPVRSECMYDIGTNSIFVGPMKTLRVTAAVPATIANDSADAR